MEEIRQKIKAGNTQLSTQFEDLKKGIASVADDARRNALEERHKNLLNETGDVFNKAEDDAKKWKEQRAAEYEKELQRQEQDLHRAKPAKVVPQKAPEPTPPTDPKRTVRRLKPPSNDAKPLPTFATGPTKTSERKAESAKPSAAKPSAASAEPLKSQASSMAATTPQKTAGTTSAVSQAAPSPDAVRKDSVPRKQSGLSSFASKFDKTLATPTKAEPAKSSPLVTEKQTTSAASAVAVGKTSKPEPTKTTPFVTEKETTSAATAVGKTPKSAPTKTTPSTAVKQRTLAAGAKAPAQNDENASPRPDLSERRKSEIKSDGAAANRIKRVLGNADNKNVKRYGVARKKTEELMNFAKDENKEPDEDKPHRHQCVHRRNRFIRKPFDIDDLLGFDKENTFEDFEARFAAAAREKRPSAIKPSSPTKRRRLENRKIWISELQDIDKLYKTSELRDIINSAK
ncbi:unnamed protein product [Toxocara canis]|uniref:INCENP_ARK-bind domain-containing protein n=1 Tax=Toxocara canis TaxID=6265 RepID=A0A183UQM3_TOXCA|nr:unnamed protein product [Toxocara canis]